MLRKDRRLSLRREGHLIPVDRVIKRAGCLAGSALPIAKAGSDYLECFIEALVEARQQDALEYGNLKELNILVLLVFGENDTV